MSDVEYILERLGKLEMDVHYLQNYAEREDIFVKRKKLHEDAIYPTQANEDDAGWDLYALEDTELEFAVPVKVKTGIAVQMPKGWWANIKPRSGLGSKCIDVLGGVIDSGYTGELVVMLVNLNSARNSAGLPIYSIKKGDKIAQLVFTKLPKVTFCDSPFTETQRGEKGFGSSGV